MLSAMNVTFRGVKTASTIAIFLWIILMTLVHQKLVRQHKSLESNIPTSRHRTKAHLSLICGNRTIEIRDRECARRFEFIKNHEYPDPCFQKHGVDVKSVGQLAVERCELFRYLVYFERICPEPESADVVFAGAKGLGEKYEMLKSGILPRAKCKSNMEDLIEKMEECGEVCKWMKLRIQTLEPSWKEAVVHVAKEKGMEIDGKYNEENRGPYSHRARLKILLHMGLLTKEYGLNFGEGALVGGPLGELVQWADLASSLQVLGHEVVLSWSPERLKSILKPQEVKLNSCKQATVADLVFTDLVGLNQIQGTLGTLYHYRCRLRVLDVYGTEPEFNHPRYNAGKSKAGTWGGKGLNPKQFLTHFPHSPDNSFLGFVVQEGKALSQEDEKSEQVLLYGKKPEALIGKGKQSFMDLLHNHFSEIHATMNMKSKKNQIEEEYSLPEYVINHGSLKQEDFLKLLRSSRMYIGLGWPVEGPAALEAIANGVVYLNPRFSPPRDTHAEKPTSRLLTSQNPYAEKYIGEPHVYTFDMKKHEEVEKILLKIKNTPRPKPKVMREFSSVGFLERVNAYIENQDFCTATLANDVTTGLTWRRLKSLWPPISSLQMKESNQGESCTAACMRHNLTCERQFFTSLNSPDVFKKLQHECKTITNIPEHHDVKLSKWRRKVDSATELCHAPSYDSLTRDCIIQSDALLFSCACASPGGVHRVCPCRSYMKEQIALCNGCT